MGLAISNIRLRDFNDADPAADKLLADFSENERISIALCMVADEYRNFSKNEKARELYQYMVDNCPDAEHAMWSQMGLAITNIRLGNYDGAKNSVEKLRADFPDDEQIANEYRGSDKHEKARELYQHVVDNWPNSEHAIWSQMGMVTLDISVGNDLDVQPALDTIIADFNDNPTLPQAILLLGERYYNRALQCQNEGLNVEAKVNFLKVIDVWERIITELPPSSITPQAYYFSAVCYGRLGEHDKAIRYYQKVVNDYPKYDLAWNALFRVGDINQVLKKSGTILKSDADLKTKAAYEQLLEKYPNCKVAEHVRDWLSR
jgi:TolA-binding protein